MNKNSRTNEIDDIISILNNNQESNISFDQANHSSIANDQDIIDLLNSSNSLSDKSDSSASWYSASSVTSSSMSLKSNKTTVKSIQATSSSCHQIDDEVVKILMHQQNLVRDLNQENINLISQNNKFKSQTSAQDTELKEMKKAFIGLTEQNRSLREQLAISQLYNVAYLKQIKSSNQEITQLSQQLTRQKKANLF